MTRYVIEAPDGAEMGPSAGLLDTSSKETMRGFLALWGSVEHSLKTSDGEPCIKVRSQKTCFQNLRFGLSDGWQVIYPSLVFLTQRKSVKAYLREL